VAYGIGTEAACWSQVGYATGYVTSLFGQLVVFREVECRAARDRRRLVVAHMFRREQLPAATLLANRRPRHLDRHAGRRCTGGARGACWRCCSRGVAKGLTLPALEQRLLQDAVAAADGNLPAAARQLGITRAQLAYRLRRRAPRV